MLELTEIFGLRLWPHPLPPAHVGRIVTTAEPKLQTHEIAMERHCRHILAALAASANPCVPKRALSAAIGTGVETTAVALRMLCDRGLVEFTTVYNGKRRMGWYQLTAHGKSTTQRDHL